MSTRAKAAVIVASLAMLLAIGVGPFLLMLVSNPVPIPADEPGGAGNGVYVGDHRGYFRLFPSATIDDRFPADAFVTSPEAAVFVKSRQYDYLSAYSVYVFPSGRGVPVTSAVSGGILSVRPRSPLREGRYVVKVSRDGAFGGSDYFFLEVRR